MNNFYKQFLQIILGAILTLVSVKSIAQTPKILGQKAHMAQIPTPLTPRSQLQITAYSARIGDGTDRCKGCKTGKDSDKNESRFCIHNLTEKTSHAFCK